MKDIQNNLGFNKFKKYLNNFKKLISYCQSFSSVLTEFEPIECVSCRFTKECSATLEYLLNGCYIKKAVFYLYKESAMESHSEYYLTERCFIGRSFYVQERENLLEWGRAGILKEFSQKVGLELFNELKTNPLEETEEVNLFKNNEINFRKISYAISAENVRTPFEIKKDDMINRKHFNNLLEKSKPDTKVKIKKRTSFIYDHEYLFTNMIEWLIYEELLKDDFYLKVRSSKHAENLLADNIWQNILEHFDSEKKEEYWEFFSKYDRAGREDVPSTKQQVKGVVSEILRNKFHHISKIDTKVLLKENDAFLKNVDFNPKKTIKMDVPNLFIHPVGSKGKLIAVVIGQITSDFMKDNRIYDKLDAFLNEMIPHLLMEERIERESLERISIISHLMSHSSTKLFTTPLRNSINELKKEIRRADIETIDDIPKNLNFRIIDRLIRLWQSTLEILDTYARVEREASGYEYRFETEDVYFQDIMKDINEYAIALFLLHINDLYDDYDFRDLRYDIEKGKFGFHDFVDLDINITNFEVGRIEGHKEILCIHLLNFLENAIEALDYSEQAAELLNKAENKKDLKRKPKIKMGNYRETSAKLDRLPKGIKFSDHLSAKIRYDEKEKLLIYKERMSEEEKKELLRLAPNNAPFLNAIEKLFSKRKWIVMFVEDDGLGMIPKGCSHEERETKEIVKNGLRELINISFKENRPIVLGNRGIRKHLVESKYSSKSGGSLGWALAMAAEYFSRLVIIDGDDGPIRGSLRPIMSPISNGQGTRIEVQIPDPDLGKVKYEIPGEAGNRYV